MPELAEVETVARGLRALAGCRIAAVRLGKTDFIHEPERLAALLPGSRIAEIRRHGKLLLIGCDRAPAPGLGQAGEARAAAAAPPGARGSVPLQAPAGEAPSAPRAVWAGQPQGSPQQGESVGGSSRLRRSHQVPTADTSNLARCWLIVHLGMTGQLLLQDPADPVAPHTHAWFALEDGRELRYVDIRRFGRLRVASPAELASFLAPLGAEPLELPRAEFRQRVGSRRARLKALLLDQHVLRGLGNIYADESLWRARLHPLRLGTELSVAELDRLWRSIRRVAAEAIRRRGTSIANYVDTQGRPGTFQRFLRVYQRTGRPCPRCHVAIERAIIAGRSSHFCPRCQRRRRSARDHEAQALACASPSTREHTGHRRESVPRARREGR